MATAHPKERPGGDASSSRDIHPRTPFHKFPGDLLLSTARRLGELGLDSELAEAIRQGSSERVVRQCLHDLREALWPQRAQAQHRREDARRERLKLIHDRYTPPEQQLANVRTWNVERHWGVPDEWFGQLGPAPAWPTDSKLACAVLEVALPDQPEVRDGHGHVVTPALPGMIRTVRELWDIISHQHPHAEKWDELHLDAEHLELLEGATYEPGLRWRVLDLGANWDKKDGIRPIDVRTPITSPNVDGFAVLAHHPRFVRRMDGIRIPFLWIPGFMVSVPGHGPRRRVPIAYFSRDGRLVFLRAGWDDGRDPYCAVPVRREYKRS